MRRLIDLLTDIKFWSILGVIVTILTLLITIQQHRDINVMFSLHARSKVEIEGTQPMTFFLLCADKITEGAQKVRIPAPVGFYNPNKVAVDIEYGVTTDGMECSLAPLESLSMKVFRKYGKLLDCDFILDADKLRNNAIVDVEASVRWIYENMSDKSSANLQIKCLTNTKMFDDSLSKGRLTVVYVPDFAKCTPTEFVYKLLDEQTLAEVLGPMQ